VVAPATAAAELRAWHAPDPGQQALRHALLAFLDARPDDACDRSCVPGHLTASALVLDATGEHTLLTLHPRVGRWVQLGGHCEPGDATLRDAALREASEESGIDGLTVDPEVLHLDVHPVTCSLGVPTRHLDVRFLVRAPAGAVPRISDESLDLRWWPLDALPGGEGSDGDGLATMVAAAGARPGVAAAPVAQRQNSSSV
jgi:8-oxo-dGTP pyrophosphatase MutT (NUDIX family)